MTDPPDDALLAAWRQLLDDPTAGGAFLVVALPPLAATLAARFPRTDPHAIETAAEDAILAFLRRPERYDPARGSLRGYLGCIARRRLANQFAADRRHHAGRIPWEGVELGLADRNEAEDDPPSFDHPALQTAIEALDDTDRRLLDLIRDGERDTPVFALAMGLADRPPAEQEREVKRAKDRIKARLKRAVGGEHG